MTGLTYRTEEIKLLKANKIGYCRRDIQILPVDFIVESKIKYSCHHQKCEETLCIVCVLCSLPSFPSFSYQGTSPKKSAGKTRGGL